MNKLLKNKWFILYASLMMICLLMIGFLLITDKNESNKKSPVIETEEPDTPVVEPKEPASEQPDDVASDVPEKNTDKTGDKKDQAEKEPEAQGDSPENPFLDPNKTLSEGEWSSIRFEVNEMMLNQEFAKASLYLYEKVEGLDKSKLAFKEELEWLEHDITLIEFFSAVDDHHHASERDVVDQARSMHSPEAAFAAFVSLSHHDRTYAILHQSSLAPVFELENAPTFATPVDYESDFEQSVKATYGENTKLKKMDVEIDGEPLSIIMIHKEDGVWSVWRIISRGDKTNFQTVSYWKEFFATVEENRRVK